VTFRIRTVTSGTGGFIPFIRRISNGTRTLFRRLLQYGLICRYSIFFLPAMISANQGRLIVVVIRSRLILLSRMFSLPPQMQSRSMNRGSEFDSGPASNVVEYPHHLKDLIRAK
jgi:hypothetical protein